MNPMKAERRIVWYTRKCREFSRMPMKQRRHERLMRYKEAMKETLPI